MLYRHQLEVLNTGDTGRWNEVLDETGVYDFYHLPAFHVLAENRGEGRAVMPVYRDGDYVMAFPLLIRDIPLSGKLGVDGLKDATSVRGFAGPLISNADIPEDTCRRFLQSLQEFLEQNDIVSVYSRLNPLLNQFALLDGYGEIVDVGVTASIDLTVPEDEQFPMYRHDHRHQVRRLKKMGFTCEEVGIDRLEDFLSIYYSTMETVNADSAYYFDRSYFEYFLCDMSDTMHLFVCRDGEKTACAGFFAECKGIIDYHLSGTADEYRKLAPMKLMIDSVREWGNRIGAKAIHLGGGVGAQKDSLYEFKMGFGSREHVYSTWRHIVNRDVYDSIYNKICMAVDVVPEEPYFPLYRHPTLSRRMYDICE